MNLKKVLAATALAGALAVMPGTANAQQAMWGGYSGFILTPNTVVTGNMCVSAAYTWFHFNSLGGPDISTVGATLGIADRLELGYTHINLHGQGLPSFNYANAKLAVTKPGAAIQLAGGVVDAFDDLDRTPYVVASVNVGQRLSGTRFLNRVVPATLRAGAGWSGGNAFLAGESVFVNGGFNLGRYAEIMGEWIDDADLTNVGIRLQAPSVGNLALSFAAMNVTRDWFPAVGASYTYCFGKEHKKKDDKEASAGSKQASRLATALRPGLTSAQ